MDEVRPDFPLAEACLNHALELDPGRPMAMANLGVIRMRQNRRDEAKRCCEQALKRDPQNHVALSLLDFLR